MKFLHGILVMAMLAGISRAQTPAAPGTTPAPSTPATAKAAAPPRFKLTYKEPKASQGGTRIDGANGGSRGAGDKSPALYVLAPNHTGLTTSAQPSLFWYQTGPANTRFELTLIEPKKPKPLLRVGIDKAGTAGIHRLALDKYNIHLEPGILYKWSIALVPDAANRSQSIFASGTIQRTEPTPELASTITAAHGLEKAEIYASNGFWYDALEAVTNQIDAAPNDKSIRQQRAQLLDQAGLKEAAASDRK